MQKVRIRLDNISKSYYSETTVTQALRKINLTFSEGEFVAITGESGSGKSTLLNIIGGMDAFDEGEIILETDMGTLSIKGDGLQIKRLDLDKKEADLEGRMDSFFYSEKKGFGAKGESFWSRLFR